VSATSISVWLSTKQEVRVSRDEVSLTASRKIATENIQTICEDETESEYETEFSAESLLLILPFLNFHKSANDADLFANAGGNSSGRFSHTPVFILIHNFRI
jgi:hypothetical protein